MAKYNYYIAKSISPTINSGQEKLGFHLRIAKDPLDNNPPFLDYNYDSENLVLVDRMEDGDQVNYTVSVWLKETNTPNALVHKDWIFMENNPPDYDKIYGKIIIHKTKLNGMADPPKETTEDLVYEPMPAEYPID